MVVKQNRLPFSDRLKVRIKLNRKKRLSRTEQEEIIEFLKKYEQR